MKIYHDIYFVVDYVIVEVCYFAICCWDMYAILLLFISIMLTMFWLLLQNVHIKFANLVVVMPK